MPGHAESEAASATATVAPDTPSNATADHRHAPATSLPPPQVEVHNAARLLHHLGEDRSLAVPRVFIELSTSKLLTMEWVEGVKVTDVAALKQMGISPRQVGGRACGGGGLVGLVAPGSCGPATCAAPRHARATSQDILSTHAVPSDAHKQ